MLLPVVKDIDDVPRMIERLDGVIVSGGVDIDPKLYGEPNNHANGINNDRDAFEIAVISAARDKQKALLGICRGTQIMNAAFGGSLFQDIPTQVKGALRHHRQEDGSETYHTTNLIKESPLTEIFQSEIIRTNSSHHQSIRELGEGLELLAIAEDGIVEAFTCPEDSCTFAVQWHPERMTDDSGQIALAGWFAAQAR